MESSLGDGVSERSDLNIAAMLSIYKMILQDIKFWKSAPRTNDKCQMCEQPSCQRLKGALLQNDHFVRKKTDDKMKMRNLSKKDVVMKERSGSKTYLKIFKQIKKRYNDATK